MDGKFVFGTCSTDDGALAVFQSPEAPNTPSRFLSLMFPGGDAVTDKAMSADRPGS